MPDSVTELASGDNYAFSTRDGVLECRVWKRPDLSWERGAELAAEITQRARIFSSGSRAFVLDLRNAPAVSGNKTLISLQGLMQIFTARKRRAAFLVGSDSQQQLQIGRLVREMEEDRCRHFIDEAAARDWVRS